MLVVAQAAAEGATLFAATGAVTVGLVEETECGGTAGEDV